MDSRISCTLSLMAAIILVAATSNSADVSAADASAADAEWNNTSPAVQVDRSGLVKVERVDFSPENVIVKDCTAYTRQGIGLFFINTNDTQDSFSDMCRVIMLAPVTNADYSFRVTIGGGTPHSGEQRFRKPGLLYNVVDENNFDFILFTLNRAATGASSCYVSGYYEGGEVYVSQTVDCDEDKQQAEGMLRFTTFDITANIWKTGQVTRATFSVQVFNNTFTAEVKCHFSPSGRTGGAAPRLVNVHISGPSMEFQYVSQSHQLTGVCPTYGPRAGSTIITLSGIALPRSQAFVKIGARQCEVLARGVDKVTAMAPPFAEPIDGMSTDVDDTPGADLQIQLFYPEKGIRLVAEETFRYLPDPVITDFYPKDTIVGGGVAVNVSGESLTSVAVHVMEVTMVYKKRNQQDQPYDVVDSQKFTSTCKVLTATLMTCPTPHIDLPPQFINLTISSVQPTKRRRRGTVEETLHGRWKRQEETLHGRWKRQEETLHGHQKRQEETLHGRQKRQEETLHGRQKKQEETLRARWKRAEDDNDSQVVIGEHTISNEKLAFYVSFKSDGVESFKEQTKDTAITVFANPSFDKFSQQIIKYNPNRGDPAISIKGKHLTVGARREDYRVIIGVGECSDIQLTINQLLCLPPGREPDTNVTALGALHVEGAPGVTVRVGNFPFFIGHLDYTGVRTTSAAAAAFLANSFFCLPAVMWTLLLLL